MKNFRYAAGCLMFLLCLFLSFSVSGEGTADPLYTYYDGVVDLTGSDAQLDGNTLTVSASFAGDLQAGSLLVLPAPGTSAGITAWQAESVTGGDPVTVTVSALDPGEAVETYDLSIDEISIVPQQAVGFDVSDGKSLRIDKSIKITDELSTDLSVVLETSVSHPFSPKGGQEADGEWIVDTDLTLSARLKGNITPDTISKGVFSLANLLEGTEVPYEPLLTPISMEVPVAGKLITVKGSISLNLRAALVGNMEYHVHKTRTIQVSGGLILSSQEVVDRDENPLVSVSGSLTVGTNITMAINLPLGSSLSLVNDSNVTVKVSDAPQYDKTMKCYDGNVSFNSGWTINAKLAISKGPLDLTFAEASIPYGPQLHMELDPLRFHIEYLLNPRDGENRLRFISAGGRPRGANLCSVAPRDQYTLRFHTGTAQKIDDAYAMAGHSPSQPKDPLPTTPLITFRHWSTEREGEPFAFGALLPEPPETQTEGTVLDLWAVWSEPCREVVIDMAMDGYPKETRYVQSQSFLEEPVIPLRMEYHFDGWLMIWEDKDTCWSQPFDFKSDRVPYRNICIRAKWVFEAGYDPFKSLTEDLESDAAAMDTMTRNLKISVQPSTVMQALTGSRNDNWSVLNDLIKVESYGGESSIVIVPAKIAGMPVTWVDGSGWANKENLQGLVLPSTCTYVSGFSNCPNLQYVVFADETVKYTGRLSHTLIFEGTETIAEKCFANCPKLRSVHFPRYISSIGKSAFDGDGLLNLDMGWVSTTPRIGKACFARNPELVTVALPRGIDFLPESLFEDCTSLVSIDTLDRIKGFGFACLKGTALKDVVLTGIQSMESYVFNNCNQLETLSVSFADDASGYAWADIEHLPKLKSVRTSGCAFLVQDAPELASYEVSDFDWYNINKKGSVLGSSYCFNLALAPKLEELVFHNSVLPELRIESCDTLRRIALLDDSFLFTDRSDDYAYCHLTLRRLPALRALEIPGAAAAKLYITMDEIGLEALDLSRYVPRGIELLNCRNLKSLTLSTLAQAHSTPLRLTITGCDALTSLTVPEGQTELTGSFGGNANLSEIILPDSLTNLYGFPFQNCPALKSVRLPNSPEFSWDPSYAFENCPQLHTLELPASIGTISLRPTSSVFSASSISRLILPGTMNVTDISSLNNRSPLETPLVVIQTPENSSLWNALASAKVTRLAQGTEGRIIRYVITFEDRWSYAEPARFEHDRLLSTYKQDDLLCYTVSEVPGEPVHLPLILFGLNRNLEVHSMLVDGKPFYEGMTMPDRDITVEVKTGPRTSELALSSDGTGLRLTSYASDTDVLAIPDQVGGYPVVEVDPAVYSGEYTVISLPSGLKTIDPSDFQGCTALQAVYGKGRFWEADGCIYALDEDGRRTSLLLVPQGYTGSLELPETVTEIRTDAVYAVRGLTGLTAPGLTRIAWRAFSGPSQLTELSFPQSLAEIAADNFSGSNLRRVEFASDCVVDPTAFAVTSTAFFGPEGAAGLESWADKHSMSYNLYSLTLLDGEEEHTLPVRAGSSLDAYARPGDRLRRFTGWQDADGALLTHMPVGDTVLTAAYKDRFALSGTVLTAVDPMAGDELYLPWGLTEVAASAFTAPVSRLHVPATVTNLPDSLTGLVGTVIADRGSAAESWAEKHGKPFEEAEYTLTLESCGGAPVAPLSLKAGAALDLPEAVRSYAGFLGWFADESLTEPFSETVMPGRDLTVYAAWNLENGPALDFACELGEDGTYTVTGYTGTVTSVTVPSVIHGIPVTAIAPYAFSGSEKMALVTLPDSIRTVGSHAFDGALNLTAVECLSDSIDFGPYAFAFCESLRSIRLPAAQTSIPDAMFRGCRSLADIQLPSSVISIGSNAFTDCSELAALALPAALNTFGPDMVRRTELKQISVETGSSTLWSDGQAVYTGDRKTLLYVCPSVTALSMPETLTVIGPRALLNVSGLKEVSLPAGLQKIGEAAFMNCGLTDLTVPSGVTEIGSLAFDGCPLDTVRIPDTAAGLGSRILGHSSPLVFLESRSGVPYTVLSPDYTVTVADRAAKPTAIAFSRDTVTVHVGETIRLTPDLTPADADPRLSFVYDNPAETFLHLTKDGQVTGLKKGAQTVWAETPDGLRASVTVQVEEPLACITDLTFFRDTSLFGSTKSYMRTVNGVARLHASDTARLDFSPSGSYAIQSWSVTSDVEGTISTVRCGSFISFRVEKLPASAEKQAFTLHVELTYGDGMTFAKDIPCCAYRDSEQALFGSLTLPESLTLFEGDAYPLAGYSDEIFNSALAGDLGIRLLSGNPDVAFADHGRICAGQCGQAVVSLVGMDGYACVVSVVPSSVALTASADRQRLYMGQTMQITASVTGADLRFVSDDESIATVSASGLVTPVSAGTVTLRAQAVKDGQVLAERTFRADCAWPYTSLDLFRTWSPFVPFEMDGQQVLGADVGSTLRLLNLASGDGNPSASSILWKSSDPSVFYVSADGVASVLKSGSVDLTATLDATGETLQARVFCDIFSASIFHMESSTPALSIGDTWPLPFAIQTASGLPTDSLSVRYEVYGGLEVDEAGIVTALEQGYSSVTIHLANRYGVEIPCDGSSYSFMVLEPLALTSLSPLPETIRLAVGETVSVVPAGSMHPAGGLFRPWRDEIEVAHPDIVHLAWDPYENTNTDALEVRGLQVGETDLTIQLEAGQSYTIRLVVELPEVFGAFDMPPKTLLVGETVALKARDLKAPGGAAVSFASRQPQVLTVTPDGQATACALGEAAVAMTVRDQQSGRTFTAETLIEVTSPLSGFMAPQGRCLAVEHPYYWGSYLFPLTPADSADDIRSLLDHTTVESARGFSYELCRNNPEDPYDDDPAAACTYLRFIDGNVAPDTVTLVTENGLQPVRTTFVLEFDSETYDIPLNDSMNLCAGQQISPEQLLYDPFGLKLAWTSDDPDIVRVNPDGTLSALAPGQTYLHAEAVLSDGTETSDSSWITVSDSSLTALSGPENTDLNISKGDSAYLSLTYEPAEAGFWAEVENPDILQVSPSCDDGDASVNLYALQEGTTSVTLRGSSGPSVTLHVSVVPYPRVILNTDSEMKLPAGAAFQLEASVEGQIPSGSQVKFVLSSGSEGILRVSESGLVEALQPGRAAVSAVLDGARNAECSFIVYEAPRSLTVSPSSLTLAAGEEAQLQVLDEQGRAAGAHLLVWSSGNEAVATVSSTGLVQAVSTGTVTLTARTRDGFLEASAAVRVTGALRRLLLPAQLETIEEEAFLGLACFDSVDLGPAVSRIDARAFADSSLIEVTIRSGSCLLDPTAFSGCSPELVIYCPVNSDVWNVCTEAGLNVQALP